MRGQERHVYLTDDTHPHPLTDFHLRYLVLPRVTKDRGTCLVFHSITTFFKGVLSKRGHWRDGDQGTTFTHILLKSCSFTVLLKYLLYI